MVGLNRNTPEQLFAQAALRKTCLAAKSLPASSIQYHSDNSTGSLPVQGEAAVLFTSMGGNVYGHHLQVAKIVPTPPSNLSMCLCHFASPLHLSTFLLC